MATIGVTSVGTGTDNCGDNHIFQKCPDTPATNGTISKVSVYCKRSISGNTGTTIACAVYSDDGSGQPGTRIAYSDTGVGVPSTAGWVDFTLSGSVVAGTTYHVGFCAKAEANGSPATNDIDFYTATNGGATELNYKNAGQPIGAWPPSFSHDLNGVSNERISAYITYAAPGGTISAPLISSSSQLFGPVLAAAGVLSAPFVASAAVVRTPVLSLTRLDAPFIGSTAAVYSASVGGAGTRTTYTTDFGAAENPLSESGVWLQGAVDGLDWHNVITESGYAHGTQLGTETGTARYSDSVAIVRGNFAANQQASAHVHQAVTPGDYFAEVELYLRAAITAHSITGYEINFSANPSQGGYCTIVRWNGPLGGFTTLSTTFPGAVVQGDLIHAEIAGSTIRVYLNGTQVNTAMDSTYASGSPGVGFYLHNVSGSGDSTQFGLEDFYTPSTQQVALARIASTATFSAPVLTGVGGLSPARIASTAQLYAPLVSTTPSDIEIGEVTLEGFYFFAAPLSIRSVRVELIDVAPRSSTYGAAEPFSVQHVGVIAAFVLLPNAAGVLSPFVAWWHAPRFDLETFAPPSNAPQLVDGILWRLNSMNRAQIWVST